jgi:hypothetical protein
MANREGWRPRVDNQPDFNPFQSPDSTSRSPLDTPKLRDAAEETTPLQGSKDLSDEDSLEDVVAGSYSTPSAQHPAAEETSAAGSSAVQGEGDYEAARRYRAGMEEFVEKTDIEELAREAAPRSAQEGRELGLAEEQGKARTKGDDPADVGIMYPGRKRDDLS